MLAQMGFETEMRGYQRNIKKRQIIWFGNSFGTVNQTK